MLGRARVHRAPLPLDRGLGRARHRARPGRAAGRHRRRHVPRAVRGLRPRRPRPARRPGRASPSRSCAALTDPAARARAVAGMERARAELTWERTAQHDARPLRARARAADVARARPNAASGRHGRRGPTPDRPWHPEMHAASPQDSRGARLRARSLCFRAAASPPGTLAQLAGAGGCVSVQTALGCTPARGLDDARAVALSPDGKSLYVASATPASVTTFSVAPGNGLLQQLNLGAGCVASIAQDGCGGARALEGASAIAVSPDNLHVYVAVGHGRCRRELRAPAQRIARAARGASPAASPRRSTPGCDAGPPLAGADAIAISPDGRFVYVGAGTADAIIVFSRDAATGRLTPLAGAAGCLRANRPNCTPVTGIDAPSGIAISPDGTSLYVTSTAAGTLTAFQRDVNRDADAAAARGRLPERRAATPTARRSAGSRAPRPSPSRPTAAPSSQWAPTTTPCSRSAATRPPARLTRVACVTATAATAGCTVLAADPRPARPDDPAGRVRRLGRVVARRLDRDAAARPRDRRADPDARHGRLPAAHGLAGLPRGARARRSARARRPARTARASSRSARSATASPSSARSSRPTAFRCGPRPSPTRRARSCSRARIRTATASR